MGVPTRVHLGYRVDRSLVAPEDVQLLAAVRPGDRVTILTPQGQERSGRCVLKYPDRAVLNLGGAHGTPGVATARNIVRVKKAK
jgi:hypothetical protein